MVHHGHPGDEGFPREDEFATLNQLEEAVAESVGCETGAIMAGRILAAGRSVLFFMG